MALANFATDQLITEEIVIEGEKVVTKVFKMMLRERGNNALRAYVFSGDGQLDSSFNANVNVY